MNESKLRMLITEAVRLDRQIATDAERLSELKAQLAAEAETRLEQATPTEGGGTSLTLEGLDGCVARVTTAGRTLKSAIKGDSKDIVKVKEIAQWRMTALFETVLAYKPTATFRADAVLLLGPVEGKKLIKLCETGGKTTVSFETKESAA